MNHVSPSVQIEALLAIERVLIPEPSVVCSRVVRRARASVPSILYEQRAVESSGRSRRLAMGKVGIAALVLTTLCSAAFYAGYRVKNSREVAPASPRAGTGAVITRPSLRAAPETVAPSVSSIPSCAPAASSADPEPAPRAPRPTKASPVAAARSESDIYAMELRVLQPAQQAVARHDYTAALASIADHRRQFPAGRLAEEREALRVKALLGLGRSAEAQYAGMAFQERFPQSALHGRMDEMLESQR